MGPRMMRSEPPVAAARPMIGLMAIGGAAAAASVASPSAAIDDFATDQRPVILYDGVCNLCNG